MQTPGLKIDIGCLEGKVNWPTWKYKVTILLRSTPGVLDVVEGILKKPTHPGPDAKAEEIICYETELQKFLKTDGMALLLLTTNMSEGTLQKVMRFSTSKEVWDELHRLFDGVTEDRSYDLCMQFFGYKKDSTHDIATHLSKMKNLWYELKSEMLKVEKSELPDILLICKILDTLPEEYFSFKSSWILMSKKDRTVENLTSQLCAHERALTSKHGETMTSMEALEVKTSKKKETKVSSIGKNRDVNRKCNYCGQTGHRVKKCQKWISDGRPPKNSTNTDANMNMMLMSIDCDANHLNEGIQKDKDNWYIDNGATNHVTSRSDIFKTFEYFDNSQTVIAANGQSIPAIGKGTVHIRSRIKGELHDITLNDVWYVPSISKNLFSVLAAQDRLQNSSFESSREKCCLKVNGKIVLAGNRKKQGGLYKLCIEIVKYSVEVNQLSKSDLLQLYHERMGHQNKRHIKKLIEKEFNIKTDLNSELCEGCIYGKAHRLKFGTRDRATKPGQLIHSDVCGPFLSSISRYRYFVLFKDDFTKYRYVYFMREKSEVHMKLKDMIAECKATGHCIQELLSDNGGEFDNEQVRKILRDNGIKQRLTMPYTPEQNGCSERENRTIVESARAMMHSHDDIPQGLWAEMTNTATYILNRTGPTPIVEKSPYELWYGKKPNIKHLRIIGSMCYAHIPKQKRRKLDKKAVKGILIGYDGDEGYRIWCKENNTLIRSRDVIFDEKPLLNKNSYELPLCSQQLEEREIEEKNDDHSDDNQSIESEGREDDENEYNDERYVQDETIDEREIAEESHRTLRDRSRIHQPARFNDFVMSAEQEFNNEPSCYREAISNEDEKHWRLAMTDEMKSLRENETWELTDLPKDRKALPCKWVYKIKMNPDGTVERFKARLVIKGFNQRKGVDYDKTFSPVAKLNTIRTLLSVAANESMSLIQFDVSTAFLNGSLEEEIFMKQPEGFEDGTKRVCKLKRSLYGLKQAPRCWNKCVHDFLISTSFKQSEADPCLYIRNKEGRKLMLALYVDDGLVASSDKSDCYAFIEELKGRFKITAKPASYFLGLELKRKSDGAIEINQAAYTKKLLGRFGMSECKPAKTPILKDASISENDDSETLTNFPYRQAVGALAYLMVGTRPDVAYAVSVVSRNLDKPTKEDVVKVKRILRYLRGTINYGIVYKQGCRKALTCYSDSDHAGDLQTGRSTTGVVCLYSGGVIAWKSQKQTSVAISTTEAELVAASEASKEIIWLKRLMNEMTTLESIPILNIDNESTLKLAQNPPYEFHQRTKHIRVRYFFVRELVTDGTLAVNKVASELQLADLMTKPLHRPRLTALRRKIGLEII